MMNSTRVLSIVINHQWVEILRLRDLLNQAFQLPFHLRESVVVLFPLTLPSILATPVVDVSGFLHSMKFLTPCDPILSKGLKAATPSNTQFRTHSIQNPKLKCSLVN